MSNNKTMDDLLEIAKKVVAEAEADAATNPTSENIQIVIVEPMKKPYKKMIPNQLEEFQRIVGGWIEIVTIGRTETGGAMAITLNEEGKIIGLPFNRRIISHGSDMLVGTFFVTAYNKQGDNISLTDEQAEKMIKRFSAIEVYL
jgi:Domain of unknown function (DUF3846)